MSQKVELQYNNEELQEILDIINALPEASGGLNTSDATATANDMAQGVTAYVNGDKITGTIPVLAGAYGAIKAPRAFGFGDGTFYSYWFNDSGRCIVEDQMVVGTLCDASEFGNATASDVAKGKTFTSASGLKLTGELVASTGISLDKISAITSGTYTPSSDVTSLAAITHNLGVIPNFCAWTVNVDSANAPITTNLQTGGAIFNKSHKYTSSSTIVYNYHTVYSGYTSSQASYAYTRLSNASRVTSSVFNITASTNLPLKAGYTYTWICGVMDMA